jgi:hypothetical protein
MWERLGYRLWICAGCERGTLEEYYTSDFLEDRDGNPQYEYEYSPPRIMVYVEAKKFKQLPPKLDKIYREVLHAFNNKLTILCAIGIRGLLEGICADKGIKGKNIASKIDGLSSMLPQNIVSNLHSIRFLGNEAAHELVGPESHELRLAIEICEDLLNYVYELDYKASRLTKMREKRRTSDDNDLLPL